jgi:uncharacterized membrane protein
VPRLFEFLKTTALGGLIFLLPLFFVGFVVGQLVPVVIGAGEAVSGRIPSQTPASVALAVGVAIALLLAICFAAGLLARLSFGRRLGDWVERKLVLLFPRYGVVRDQMVGNVGGATVKPRAKPVLVTFDDHVRVGLESDRSDDWVAVYLPTAPDAWSGFVVYVAATRVRRLDVEFAEAVAACEQLGRDSVAKLFGPPSSVPGA